MFFFFFLQCPSHIRRSVIGNVSFCIKKKQIIFLHTAAREDNETTVRRPSAVKYLPHHAKKIRENAISCCIIRENRRIPAGTCPLHGSCVHYFVVDNNGVLLPRVYGTGHSRYLTIRVGGCRRRMRACGGTKGPGGCVPGTHRCYSGTVIV